MTAQFLILTAALATGVAAAQQPTSAPPKPSSNTTDDRVTTPAVSPTVVVEGCVAVEDEVPGRKSNITERAGLSEDFILTQARVVRGKAPVGKDHGGGVVSAGLRPMYEIGGLKDDQLKALIGKRVRIEGAFANVARDAAPSHAKNDDLVELNGTTVRQVGAECTAPKS